MKKVKALHLAKIGIYVLILFFLFSARNTFATTYTYTANSPSSGWQSIHPSWTDQGRWDTYPGTTINAGDEVLIYGLMNIDVGIVNNGNIIVKNRYEWCILSVCFYKEKGDVNISQNAMHFYGNGTMTNNGNFSIESGGTLSLYGGYFYNNGSVNSDGKINTYSQTGYIGLLEINTGSYLTNNGNFYNFGGDIVIKSGGHLNNLGHLTSVSPSLRVGTITLNTGGTLSWRPSNSAFPDADFTWIGGNFVVTGGGQTSIGAALTIPPDGTLTINGLFSYNSTLTNNGSIVINGQINIPTTSSTFPIGNVTWNSGGTIKVTSPTEYNLTDNINIPTGAFLEAATNLKISGIVSNNGTLRALSGGKITINNSYNFDTGIEDITSGSEFILAAGSTSSLSSNLTIATNSTLNIYGKLNLNTGGTITNNGSLVLRPGGEYLLNYADAVYPTGTVDWQDGSTIGIGVNGSALVENFNFPFYGTIWAGKIFANYGTFGSTNLVADFGVQGLFINHGTCTFNSGIGGNIHNYGTITANGSFVTGGTNSHQYAGTLNLNKATTYNLELYGFEWHGGNINISSNSIVNLSQTTIPLNSTLTNNGRVIIDGSYFDLTNNGTIINNSYLILGQNDFTNNGTITNNDSLIVRALGFFYNKNIINNTVNGKIINQGDFWNYETFTNAGNFKNENFYKNKKTFSNSGTFNHSAGNFVIATQPSIQFPTGVFNWGGIVTLDTATHLTLTSTLTVPDAQVLVNIGSIVLNSGGNLKIGVNSEVKNYGLLQINGTGAITSPSGILSLNTGSNFELNNSTASTLGGLAWYAGDVTIGSLADLTISSNLNVPVGNNLAVNGILRIGVLGFSGGIVNNGNFNLNSTGKIYFNASSELGQMTWNSGAKIIVNSGVNFSINNALSIPNGGIFENYGNVQLSPGSALSLQPGAVFNIYNSAKVSVYAPITNYGTINLKSGGEYSLKYNTTLPAPSTNFVWETGGILSSGGGAYLSLASPYTVPSGRILKMDGGVFSVNKKLTNEGTINLSGNLTITDTLVQNNKFNNISGNITVRTNAILILNDTINIPLNQDIWNEGIVKINQGGKINGPGKVDLRGTGYNGKFLANQIVANINPTQYIWNEGSTVIIGESSTFEAPVGFTIPANKKFQNDGLMLISSGQTLENNGFFTVNGTLNDNGTLNNNTGSTFTNNGTANINGSFNNNGTIENTSNLNLNNTGLLALNTGNITLAGLFNWLPGGDLTIGPMANMYLANTLTIPASSTLNVDGLLQINPNGIISNNGLLSLNSGGNFIIKDTTDFITGSNFIWNTGGNVEIGTGGLLALNNVFTIPTGTKLTIAGGVLELNAGGVVTNLGTLDLNNYGNIILNENPNFLVNGGFNWNTQGQVTIGEGVILNMATDLTIAYSGILENNGKIIIPSGKTLTNLGSIFNNDSLINNGTVINTNSGNSQIHNDGVFINNSTLTSTQFFYNQGQLVLNTAAAALPGGAFNWSAGDVTIGPNGVFDLNSNISYNPSSKFNIEGILNLNTNGKLSGVVALKSGGILKLNQAAEIRNNNLRGGSSYSLINTFDWQNGGILEITNSNTLTNSEEFSIPTNSILRINGSFLSSNTITNNGIIDLNTGGSMTFQSGNVVFPSGVFNWNGGSLAIGSSAFLNLTNTFTIPAARTLENDGTLTIGAGGVLINEGTFTNNSIFNLNTEGEYSIKKAAATLPNGTFNWNGGKVSIASPSSLNLTSGFIIPSNGTLAVETAAIFNINANGILTQEGTLELNGGALNLNTSGVLDLNKANAQLPGSGFNWTAGTVKIGQVGTLPLTSALNIPVSGTFDIYGHLAYNNGASFNNLGVFNIKSGGNLDFNATTAELPNGTFNWNSGGNINVNSGSVFNLAKALEIPASSSLINAGTFNINNLGILSIAGTFTNNGITNLNTGGKYLIAGNVSSVPKTNFNWNTGGVFEITSTGTLTLSDSLTIPYQRQLINKGQLAINANGVLTQMGSLDNQGTFDLNDLGYLILKTSPLETNPATVSYPNGNFNWNIGGVVLIAENSIFNNQYPFIVPTDRRLIIKGTFQNNNTLDISGEVLMESDIINTSTINLNDGGQMRFNMPNMTFPGSTFNWNTGGIVEVGNLSTLALNTLLTVPEFSTLKIVGTLDINTSGILSALGSIDNQGNMNINNGGKYLLHKANFIDDFNDINWNTGGIIEIAPLASLSISGPTTIPYGRTLKNNGTINIGNGALFGNSVLKQIGILDNMNGELNINTYGVLELITDPLDVTGTVTYPTGILNWNYAGLMRVPVGSTFKNKSPFNIPSGREFIVDGALENTSTLKIDGAVRVSGSLANSAGGIIDLNDGGNLDLSYESAMKPANTFNWKSGGQLSIGYGGSINLSSVFNIPLGGIFNIKGKVTLLTGGSLSNLGTVDLEGDLVIDDNNAWIPTGTFNWNGRVVLAKNHIFHLANELTIPISGRLSNKSMLTIDLGGKLIVDGSLSNDSTILNKNILYVSNNGYLDNYNLIINEDTLDNENSIFNLGTITNAETGTIINHWDIYQEGNMYNYGTLTGEDGYFYTDFSVAFINFPGSKIAPGDGATPGYTLFDGNLDLGSTGLAINLDGALQKKDLLDISGNATINNAILNLNYISPPTSSKVDTIVVYNTKVGQFAQVNYPTVPGFTFAVTYLPNAVTLTTTADCVQNRNITTTISTNQTLTAAQVISANAIISINAKVTFSAGNSVLLLPGFKAENGSVFLANVGGCN
ncbi:hypothetical protein EGI22_04565 [Lacihabitans sp. LS3-19]|uniref:beta strand repeat-containing protein n=1 Tax=Lacihabitans sp. LS3-19 TaxID=2487335 RepID=UPI0020CF7017|nr:3-coathanger stack domain-containing protein [Lacihabitans sp. LS3-19]MCP9767171.1 hypothetical protein [Lacihabitans sp. LS3-19]